MRSGEHTSIDRDAHHSRRNVMAATLTGKRVRVRVRVNLASRRATRSPRLRKNASNGFCRQREEVPVRRQPPSLPSESLSLSLSAAIYDEIPVWVSSP